MKTCSPPMAWSRAWACSEREGLRGYELAAHTSFAKFVQFL